MTPEQEKKLKMIAAAFEDRHPWPWQTWRNMCGELLAMMDVPCGVCGWKGEYEYNAHPDRQVNRRNLLAEHEETP